MDIMNWLSGLALFFGLMMVKTKETKMNNGNNKLGTNG